MKIILLIALLVFAIASAEVIPIKKNLARTVAPEEVALEIKVFGTCQEFATNVLPTLAVSRSVPCLPIQVGGTPQNLDNNDLHTHYFCTKVDDDRSIVHFVEIFATDDNTPVPHFVVSFVPKTPFRVLTPRTSLARRPDCFITEDYCDHNNSVVNDCRTNRVVIKNRYVVSHDRIYISGNEQVATDCKTVGTSCCPYTAPRNFGGICEYKASDDLLSFPERHHHHNDDHHDNDYHDNDRHDNDHHGKPGNGRPGQGRPGNNDHHDNDHHNNDHHNNDHHNNDHHNNDHHDNDYHDNDRHDNDRHDGPHGGRPGQRPGQPGRPFRPQDDNDKRSATPKIPK